MDINKHFVSGRICTDLELKQTTTGTPVTSFRIASERNFKNKDGERDTDFLSIVAFSGTAEFITKYFSKSRKILIGGRVQARNYTDRDGNKRTAVETIADEAYFMDNNSRETVKDDGSDESSAEYFQEIEVACELPF